MGSVTIIVIIPLFLILFIGSSLIGAVTGGDRTQVVLPYEPEKGIVWECDVPDSPVELVKTEVNGNTQIFWFKSTKTMDLIKDFAEISKGLITDVYPEHEYTYGDIYKITFTDANGNEQIYYAESNLNLESIYFETPKIYSPDEYYAFDYTVTAQQPVEGEYGWYNQDYSYRTEHYKAEYSPTRTVTIVHTDDIKEGEEYYYSLEYGHIDNYEAENETVKIKYVINDGKVEILEENHTVKENQT